MASKITALKQQKRNPNRVNVYLDGKFSFGVAKILAAWLQVGQELSDEEITELQGNDDVEKAFQRGLNFISYRPRSRMEVVRNLRKHAVPEAIIDQAVDRLSEKKIVDDLRFAQEWVENRNSFRPRGLFALRAELRQKGIEEELINLALQDIDEEELIRLAAAKKTGQLAGLEWKDFRKKLSAYLSRRGFDYSLINEICRESWEGQMSKEHQ